jgi:gliding motility-associated-like protein
VTHSIEANRAGTYWLQVTDQNNCVGNDSVVVRIKDCNKKLFVPDAFTPNADGKNELFKPVFTGNVKSFHFCVYNRWGQLVFQTSSTNKAWDGKVNGQVQGAATFVWVCTYRFIGEEEKIEKGVVSIIR